MPDYEKCTAIVLAGGRGTRMQSSIQKQYMQLHGKPLICHSLDVFEDSSIDQIVLVAGQGEAQYCRKEIVEKYNYKKVSAIAEGGQERYHSVFAGIKAAGYCDYLFIHDGARPFVDQGILTRTFEGARKYGACAAGMPAKDTIKMIDEHKFTVSTPNRKNLWIMQTPQVFQFNIIYEAYEKLFQQDDIKVTDDTMVVEQLLHKKVKLVEGSYRNIKITTPEDLLIAEVLYTKQNRR